MAFENAMLAAITISRLGAMLPLASMSMPTVTGASWLLKKLISCGRLSSRTRNES